MPNIPEIMPNTPPQVGAWISKMHNLRKRASNWFMPKAFVEISASWTEVWTYLVTMFPELISSQIKWQSTSICFVHLWYTGLAAMCNATWLSQ